jgi:hypothetical protein
MLFSNRFQGGEVNCSTQQSNGSVIAQAFVPTIKKQRRNINSVNTLEANLSQIPLAHQRPDERDLLKVD